MNSRIRFHHETRGIGHPMLTKRRGFKDCKKHCIDEKQKELNYNSYMKHYSDEQVNYSKLRKNDANDRATACQFICTLLSLMSVFLIWQSHRALTKYNILLFNSSDQDKPKHYHKMLVNLESLDNTNNDSERRSKKYYIDDPMLFANTETNAMKQENQSIERDRCVPMEEWQTHNKPTCNVIHELSLQEGVEENTSFQIIGNGWFRHTWKIHLGSKDELIVLKTLRFEREFLREYYELHRRESIAMERLTKSPFVIDIYSFCAQTTINEYADFIDGFQNLQSFARQLRTNNDEKILTLKLQIASMIALGVQHIHEVDTPGNATLVHNDINPMNVVITQGGIPKINDFNLAEFMRWDNVNFKRCGFAGRFNEPWWRSPEEMKWSNYNLNTSKEIEMPELLDEKIDIYSLGNIIYLLLTGHSPRGRINKDRIEQVRKDILIGSVPVITNDTHLANRSTYLAMKKAMYSCFEPEPKSRSSGREIAQALLAVVDKTNEKHKS